MKAKKIKIFMVKPSTLVQNQKNYKVIDILKIIKLQWPQAKWKVKKNKNFLKILYLI